MTFSKFASCLQQVAPTLQHHRMFFQCLIAAILRHKSKLSKPVRDAIVESWLTWLRSFKEGSATSAAHECFILLLNEWSGIGNLVLPRDTLLKFSKEAVDAVNAAESSESKSVPNLWQSDDLNFTNVRKQYLRMLKMLPASNAKEWKEEVGILKEQENP